MQCDTRMKADGIVVQAQFVGVAKCRKGKSIEWQPLTDDGTIMR